MAPPASRCRRLQLGDLTSAELAAAEVERLIARSDPPTALFTAQNLITIGAVRALHRRGRQSEIALVGFDDLALAELLTPGITVIAQDPAEHRAGGRGAPVRPDEDDDSGRPRPSPCRPA